MRLLLFITLLSGIASGSISDSRYTIVDGTLIFDMTIEEPGYEFTGEVETYDAKVIKNYLFDNTEINTFRVTGPGGHGSAGRAISDYLVQHSINTEAFGECASACAKIFLGGKSRQLAKEAA